MRGRILAAVALLVGLSGFVAPGAAHATPPGDDNFAFAGNHSTSPLDPNSSRYDLTEATLEPGEPLPSCGPLVDRSVWLRADATLLDDVTHPHGYAISYHADNPWPVSDAPTIAIYEGSSLATLHEVACSTPYNEGGGSISYHSATRISAWLPAHGTLYVQLTASGPHAYNVSGAPMPAGDDRYHPQDLEPNWRLRPAYIEPDLPMATIQPGDPAPSCATPASNVWYTVGPGLSTSAVLHLDQYPIGAYAVVRRTDTGAEVLCLTADGSQATGDVSLDNLTQYTIELGLTGSNLGGRAFTRLTIFPS